MLETKTVVHTAYKQIIRQIITSIQILTLGKNFSCEEHILLQTKVKTSWEHPDADSDKHSWVCQPRDYMIVKNAQFCRRWKSGVRSIIPLKPFNLEGFAW